jgi:hypothetical protein
MDEETGSQRKYLDGLTEQKKPFAFGTLKLPKM